MFLLLFHLLQNLLRARHQTHHVQGRICICRIVGASTGGLFVCFDFVVLGSSCNRKIKNKKK